MRMSVATQELPVRIERRNHEASRERTALLSLQAGLSLRRLRVFVARPPVGTELVDRRTPVWGAVQVERQGKEGIRERIDADVLACCHRLNLCEELWVHTQRPIHKRGPLTAWFAIAIRVYGHNYIYRLKKSLTLASRFSILLSSRQVKAPIDQGSPS